MVDDKKSQHATCCEGDGHSQKQKSISTYSVRCYGVDFGSRVLV